jgi:general secretion pathway protein L
MSAAKFKSALPNLLEEQLTSDPADVALVATPVVNGEATVAVADRAWLETIAAKVKDWPVKKIAAFPSQLALTLPGQENHAAALIENRDGVLALTIRQSELQAWGSIWLRRSVTVQSPC